MVASLRAVAAVSCFTLVLGASVAATAGPASASLSGLATSAGASLRADAAATTSRFVGTIYKPDRGDSTAVIRGDLYLEGADCPETVGEYELLGWQDTNWWDDEGGPYYYVGLMGSRWIYSIPVTAPAHTYFNKEINDLPADNYTFAFFAKYKRVQTDEKRYIRCTPLSTDVVSVVEVVGKTSLTEASSKSISVGESVTLSLKIGTQWSDGVVTYEQAPSGGTYSLQSRVLGTMEWKPSGSGRTVFTVSLSEPTEFRFLVGNVPTDPVAVDVVRPTGSRRLANVSVNPPSAIAGALLTLTADSSTQFTDSSWKPSPVGTPFEVQFLARGATAWNTVHTGVMSRSGSIIVQFPMSITGQYRISSGTAVSDVVGVSEIEQTSAISFSDFSVPRSTKAGKRISVSVNASVEYTDGAIRPLPISNFFSIQFAESSSPRPANSLVWRRIEWGQPTQPGLLTAQVRLSRSGFIRLELGVGGKSTQPVFVRVKP